MKEQETLEKNEKKALLEQQESSMSLKQRVSFREKMRQAEELEKISIASKAIKQAEKRQD